MSESRSISTTGDSAALPEKSHPDEKEQTTPIQLALDIFKSFNITDQKIEDSPQEIGFRKNNMFLEITGMGLAAKRAIDVAYFIVAQSNDENELYTRHAYTYSVDHSFFKWLMGTGSRNWRHLRSVLREAQAAAIEITEFEPDSSHTETRKSRGKKDSVSNESPSNWGAVPLLGAVAVSNGRVIFEVNPTLAKHIKQPQSSHFISLRYVFRSLYGKNLYDLIVPFLNNAVTPWIDLDKLRTSLACKGKTNDQYKYLRQFVLLPAMAEVEAVTGIRLELQTHNLPKTRKIGYVRFLIERKEEATLDHNRELQDVFLTLRKEFGLNNKQFDEVTANRDEWTLSRIQDAMEYTRHQIKKGVVKVASLYLMKALRENYTLGTAQLEIDKAQEKKTPNLTRNESQDPPSMPAPGFSKDERKSLIEAGLKVYNTLSNTARLELALAFIKSPQGKIAATHDKVDFDALEEGQLLPTLTNRSGLLHEEFALYVRKPSKQKTHKV